MVNQNDTEEMMAPIFFNAKEIGQSLQEISVEIIKTEAQDVVSRWFHSNKDADLFIWTDERKNIIKQQVSFCGQVVEWNILEGVKTGFVIEEDESEEAGKPGGSEIIHFDKSPQGTSLGLALDLVRFIENLDDDERGAILRNFSESPKMDEIDPEEFVRQYGSLKPHKPPRPSFWERILNCVKRRA